MKRNRQLPSEWTLTQCLFGEHLLKRFPSREVRIVEAEKTAVICAGFMPQFVWMATGGKSQLNARLDVLRGRRATLFPDVDGYTLWKAKAAERRDLCLAVSDYLERHATDEDRRNKIDIANLLVRWKQSQPTETKPTPDFSDIDPSTLDAVRRCADANQMQQTIDLIRDLGLVATSFPPLVRSRLYNRIEVITRRGDSDNRPVLDFTTAGNASSRFISKTKIIILDKKGSTFQAAADNSPQAKGRALK